MHSKGQQPSFAVLVALLCLSLLVPGVSLAAESCQGAVYGADSPEALVQGVRGAAESGNMGQLAQYLSAADRSQAGLGLTIGATMMLAMQEMGISMSGEADAAGDSEAKKAELASLQSRLAAILAKYGVEQPSEETMGMMMQQGPAAMENMPDMMKDVCTVGLIDELATFLSEVSNQKVSDQLARLKNDDVGPIETNGDTATVTIGGEPFQMHRVDGRWYVDIESTGH
jgi:hypothetical protein